MKASLILFFCMAALASAHIGETPQECVARYGQSFEKQTNDFGWSVLLFKKNGFDIFITYLDGKAQKIQYGHSNKNSIGIGDKLSDNEIQLLLKANDPGEWKKDNQSFMDEGWINQDATLLAAKPAMQEILFVVTKQYMAAQQAETKAKETRNLQGM
jgi:hypothetical protein